MIQSPNVSRQRDDDDERFMVVTFKSVLCMIKRMLESNCWEVKHEAARHEPMMHF